MNCIIELVRTTLFTSFHHLYPLYCPIAGLLEEWERSWRRMRTAAAVLYRRATDIGDLPLLDK